MKQVKVFVWIFSGVFTIFSIFTDLVKLITDSVNNKYYHSGDVLAIIFLYVVISTIAIFLTIQYNKE